MNVRIMDLLPVKTARRQDAPVRADDIYKTDAG